MSVSHVSTQAWSISTIQKWLQPRTSMSGRFWITFAVVMALVAIIRMPWILPNGLELNLTPGEYSHFRIPLNKAFLWTHLASVLPAGVLAVTQFVPRIRARAMNFHRNAGKAINILTFISTLSAWGIARVSFGGDTSIQAGAYVLGTMTLWSTVKSWKAIRRLQIDEHRAWLIRAWSYQMSVITLRIVSILLVICISAAGGFYFTMPCEDVEFVLNDQDAYAHEYPQCQAGWTGSQVTHVSVKADAISGGELGSTAAIRAVFGTSTWTALWIHAVVCEYYLFQTRDESERLKELSTKRQKVRQVLKERQSSRQ